MMPMTKLPQKKPSQRHELTAPKHRCIADTNTMMRASHSAPIYKCKILRCGKLVYSNGIEVNVDDYNLQIAIDMIKENKPPTFWVCFDLGSERRFLGAYSNKKRALARLQNQFGKKVQYKIVKGMIVVSKQMYSKKGVILKGKQKVALALRVQINENREVET